MSLAYGAYLLGGSVPPAVTYWTFFFVPEASGRTLDQMDHLFRDSTSEAEEARRHAIESELVRGRKLLD